MNLLLFSAADRLDAQHIRVMDRRLEHLLEVHRAKSGDSIRVGEISGLTGSGTIVSLSDSDAVIQFNLERPPPDKLPLTMVLALPRPKVLRRVLRTVAELGIAELHLINSYRVEKSYWQSPVLKDDTVQHYLLQGLEQAMDTRLPRVEQHRRFKPFVEDRLPKLLHDKRALLAHPGDFPSCPNGPVGDTLLVVGPEGGFIPYEVDKLRAAGCQTVALGPRILRVENAVTALVGRLL